MNHLTKKLCVLSMAAILALAGCSSPTDDTPTVDNTDATQVAAVEKTTVFVKPDWVKSVIDNNQPESENFVVLEASWGAVGDSPDYGTGHIPGAIHVDIASIEGEPYWNLNEPSVVEKAMLDLGITKDTTVILYGADVSGTARVAYAYLWAGVENVKVINGGLAAWSAAGYELETDIVQPIPATEFGTTVPAHPEYWISVEDVATKLENDTNFRLISIRSKEEFDGLTSGYSYIDKAGEPKGAIWGHAGSSPYAMEDYTNEDGTYVTIADAEKLWEGYDISKENELSFYCGTGWRATIPFLLCYEAGYENINLYDGGWYQWQMNDELPVQVGDPTSPDVIYTTVGELPTDKAAK